MNGLLLAIVTLLVLAPVASAISCYYGTSVTGYQANYGTYDVCIIYSALGITTKSGLGTGSGSVTCSYVTSTYSGYTCCSTGNNCNGAKTNGVSILMASVAGLVALFRSM